MLGKIKSELIKKILFSFLYEKTKLDIVKYNKNLQKVIRIGLINYKYRSRRYIEFDANGKGKEYNHNDQLIYEGEYLNGKRNGKGKEYDNNGQLKFEGEYFNGQRWKGNVKEYYHDYDDSFCDSIYEGEYLNDQRWKVKKQYDQRSGKWKEYNYKGNLIFEGIYLNGKRWNKKN